MGDGVVELAGAVAASADQREHLAGVGIEGDERDLRIDVRAVAAQPCPLRAARVRLSTSSSTT